MAETPTNDWLFLVESHDSMRALEALGKQALTFRDPLPPTLERVVVVADNGERNLQRAWGVGAALDRVGARVVMAAPPPEYPSVARMLGNRRPLSDLVRA